MTDMPLYLHFIYSFFATVGFAIFLNAPKSTLISSGFVGGLGWSVFYYLVKLSGNDILANFIAALLVSYFSEILARKLRQPAIIFIIPGIIPLVPGLGMYNTMLYLVQHDYNNAISKGADVLFVGGAISLGILVVTSLVKTLHMLSIKKAAK
ncbi:threonine/serine exporter family protein [Terrisporobacter petrolearius]|uniref:threonine/serine exporter family protein n=1 Tax=Terrisporobacter petrolearius TaxID=1460447 RepID=UPI001D16C882|nr:threonine/serine exporter family protein [Terrisporobacter petrolearius]MCC3864468.1 threonine/serine exporter family protein [Terrisporobacter petrolearius]